MRILAHVHRYPPLHNAGAEWALHHTLTWLVGRGHEVRVLTSLPATAQHDRILVTSQPGRRQTDVWYDWADIVVTHLDVTRFVIQHAARRRLPVVHLVHNQRQLAYHRVAATRRQLAVFNSAWVADATAWAGPGMILYPPVPPTPRNRPLPTDTVLFSNPTAAKGAPLVWAMAERTPDLRWLVVRGAYGPQQPTPDLPNVVLVDQTPDFGALLRQAGLVVMPSSYESWGRVAVEAAQMGIPSVCSDMPGPTEAGVAADLLGVDADTGGGVVATDQTVEAWTRAVRRRVGDTTAGGKARQRALELWDRTLIQLGELEQRMLVLADGGTL